MVTKTTDEKLYSPAQRTFVLPAWINLALEEGAEHNQTTQVQIVREAIEGYLIRTLHLSKEQYLERTSPPPGVTPQPAVKRHE